MLKRTLLAVALSSLACAANAHQLWLERDASGTVRVYFGEAAIAPDRGEGVAKLASTTQVFTTDRTRQSKLAVKDDHLEATVIGTGDVRLINDQPFKPWTTPEGVLKATVYNAREGRSETRGMLELEFVPIAANGNAFTLNFKGQPLADKEVIVINPEKWTKQFKTDAQGRVEVPLKATGRYILIAEHSVDEVRQVADQTAAQAGYTTTISFVTR